jgi:aminoglycoside 2''-phosphotransferase
MTTKKVSESIMLALPGWTIDAVSFLGEGDFYRAYLVNHEWVFRFAKHAAALQSLKKEYCLLPQIAGLVTLEIPLPEIVSFETGKTFSAYRFLAGDSLSPEVYLSLGAEERTRCARQVAGFLNQLHSVEITLARDCGVGVCDYVSQYSALLEEARGHLFEMLAEPERLFIEAALGDYLASDNAVNFQPALLHGDLSPEHLIFDEEKSAVSGVIDFGDVMIGDAAWDLLWLYED